MDILIVSVIGAVGVLAVYAVTMWKARRNDEALHLRARRDLFEGQIEHAQELLEKTTDHDLRMKLLKGIGNAEAEIELIDLELQGWSVRRDA